VSIPLPGGPATVTATVSPGWTITGWHTDNAGVTGGPTDAQHATWSVPDGSTLAVSAAGQTAPPAILSVTITPAGGAARSSSYALN
jgi:hypothetical protein